MNVLNTSLQRKNADVFRFRGKKRQAFKLEMQFWKKRIEQNDLSDIGHVSAVTVETVDENAAVQMKPLIFMHLTAFG
jgi:hypothetical protein